MELMIVLLVLAIVGSAAYPWLSNVRQVLLVKGTAEQTVAAIRLARQFAILHQYNHCIEFAAGHYRIRQADAASGVQRRHRLRIRLASPFPTGNVVTTAPTLIFDPIGNRILPAGPANTIFTVDTSPSACLSTITVTLYGGVRLAGC